MRRTGHRKLLVGYLFASWAGTASAAVTQPDGMTVPIDQALSRDYFDNRYREGTLGLDSMFSIWEGLNGISASRDGIAAGYGFEPLCTVTGALILRGGACLVDFGWYCVDDSIGGEVIHPFVTAQDIVAYHDGISSIAGKPPPPPNTWAEYKTNDKGFVPTIQSGYLRPATGAASTQNLRAMPEFAACKSGRIGFAFRGVATSLCPMSKFSEPRRNQLSQFGGLPWVSAIVYGSKKTQNSFYVAFEDYPTSPASFTPTLGSVQADFPQMTSANTGWETWKNDGDFNDLVYKVDGVICAGAGYPCTPTTADGTPALGACSLGVTGCSSQPDTLGACIAQFAPTAESCNGRDDDCNGIADDGAGLCPSGLVCDSGRCVQVCYASGASCPASTPICKMAGFAAGLCVESACEGVECLTGQRCVAGKCLDGCEGRTCPTGQTCIAGGCADPCAAVVCPTNTVCERGVCIPDCRCRPCADATKTCNAQGHCTDASCANVNCDPFKACVAGACVDPCAANPCGGGSDCVPASDGTITCTPRTASGGAGGMNNGGSSGAAGSIGSNGGVSAGAGTNSVATSGSAGSLGSAGGATLTQPSAGGSGGTIVTQFGGARPAGTGTAAAGSGASQPRVCAPGKQEACTCTDGSDGAQECASDGKQWERCVCGEAPETSKDGCGCVVARKDVSPYWAAGALLLFMLRRKSRRARCYS